MSRHSTSGRRSGRRRADPDREVTAPNIQSEEIQQSYAVGYARPPKHTRFKKGRSGNPRGRPKATRSLRSEIQKVLSDKISVQVGGKRQRVSAVAALHLLLLQRALKGDLRAAAYIFRTAKEFGMLEEAQGELSVEEFLPPIFLDRVKDETLVDLLRVVRELGAEAAEKNKTRGRQRLDLGQPAPSLTEERGEMCNGRPAAVGVPVRSEARRRRYRF